MKMLFKLASSQLILFFLTPTFVFSNKPISNDSIINIGSRLELFVDDYLINSIKGNARLQLNQPEIKEIVLTFDEPWEGNCGAYRSVFFDGIRYRMYYNTYDQRTQVSDTLTRWYTCYAESHDGINWYKPNLGLYEFQGSKNNNIVFINGVMGDIDTDGVHCAVFKDENPNVPPEALYKAIMNYKGKPRGLIVYKSPDGINWQPMTDHAVITDGAFDSQNLAFWDNDKGEYRAYWRYFTDGTDNSPYKGIRGIRTARSNDLISWYDQEDLTYVNSPSEVQLYTNQIKPYFRAPHIFIGLPTRYIDRGWSESMKALPEFEDREWRSSLDNRYGTAITEGLFMTSRDGVLFNRWDEAFLRPGIERPGTWNYGNIYLSWSIIETKSSLKGAPNELSFYTGENFRSTTDNVAVRRYTLRKDGFVSVNAPTSGGELVTKLLTFTGNKLILNFSTSAAGDIKVEIQDENGSPMPGYKVEDCDPIFGDSIERVVKWKNAPPLSSLDGKAIRLRFVLKDADLYSIRFQ